MFVSNEHVVRRGGGNNRIEPYLKYHTSSGVAKVRETGKCSQDNRPREFEPA